MSPEEIGRIAPPLSGVVFILLVVHQIKKLVFQCVLFVNTQLIMTQFLLVLMFFTAGHLCTQNLLAVSQLN